MSDNDRHFGVAIVDDEASVVRTYELLFKRRHINLAFTALDGGEAIEKLKSINPDVKVILSSGYSINGMAREIMNRSGVHSFLQKPFHIDQLMNKINEFLTTL